MKITQTVKTHIKHLLVIHPIFVVAGFVSLFIRLLIQLFFLFKS